VGRAAAVLETSLTMTATLLFSFSATAVLALISCSIASALRVATARSAFLTASSPCGPPAMHRWARSVLESCHEFLGFRKTCIKAEPSATCRQAALSQAVAQPTRSACMDAAAPRAPSCG